MKKIIYSFISLIVFLSFAMNFNFPVNENNIKGVYIDNYYIPKNSKHIRVIDTLILGENNRIYSKYYGNGTYKFETPNRISINPSEERYKYVMPFSTNIENHLFNNIVINVTRGVDWYYYKKIE